MKAHKFWNWLEGEGQTLVIDGPIAEETWFGDEVTPKLFKQELVQHPGDVTIWLNSPGGDCIAASQIYTMLMDRQGATTIKIDGLAASAASVIAMAGSRVLMAPTALMMIHNPLTVAIGDSEEMERAVHMLGEVKESIINAYELKTGLDRQTLSDLMDGETWFNAHKAIEFGFCDGLLEEFSQMQVTNQLLFSRRAVTNQLLEKLEDRYTQSAAHLHDRLKQIKENF